MGGTRALRGAGTFPEAAPALIIVLGTSVYLHGMIFGAERNVAPHCSPDQAAVDRIAPTRGD